MNFHPDTLATATRQPLFRLAGWKGNSVTPARTPAKTFCQAWPHWAQKIAVTARLQQATASPVHAFLIKKNHIAACGWHCEAVSQARKWHLQAGGGRGGKTWKRCSALPAPARTSCHAG